MLNLHASKKVRTPKPSDDLYNLARALALGAPPSEENVKLLDRLLDIGTEEWGLSGIIYALCRDWGTTEIGCCRWRILSCGTLIPLRPLQLCHGWCSVMI